MHEQIITFKELSDFRKYLSEEEKSEKTIEKYCRDVKNFIIYMAEKPVCKSIVVDYKKQLEEYGYSTRSINSMLASVNSFLKFINHPECIVKSIRIQRKSYCDENRELTKSEYLKLLNASSKNKQLNLIIQTICGTGIRVSELKYFTVESVKNNKIEISCKSKIRTILIPVKLKKLLLQYANKKHIESGQIFITRSGNPVDRSNIWSRMKNLCRKANVKSSKVFPHNLRKLFARTFYSMEKDIAKLADILGHGNIETTRIYIMSTGTEHRRKIDRLGLVV